MKNVIPLLGLLVISSIGIAHASMEPITTQAGATTRMLTIKNDTVTRSEFLESVLGASGREQQQCRRAFRYTDVDWSADYGTALQVASCLEIVKGNPDGTFKPHQGIAYAEAAKIITLAFDLPMTREMHRTWYGGYIQTLSRLEISPRKNIKPSDVLNTNEMKFMINALTKDTNTANADGYLGLTVEQAQALAEKNGVPFRVLMVDGQASPTTLDHRVGRINAEIENDIVVEYRVEGREKTTDYNGLTVKEAQSLAEANNVPFRVVMRDGEALPTNMDYLIGRINATVENGQVTSHQVEGQAEEKGITDNLYIGLTIEQAQEAALQNNVSFRVVKQDGKMLPTTRDFQIGRINATVVDGKVAGFETEKLKNTSKQFKHHLKNPTREQMKTIIQLFVDRVEMYREPLPESQQTGKRIKWEKTMNVVFRFNPNSIPHLLAGDRTTKATDTNKKTPSPSENVSSGGAR